MHCNVVSLCICLLGVVVAVVAEHDDTLYFQVPQQASQPQTTAGKHWAVIVAGSNGWYNYRHQADICHAYQILKRHGLPENQVITMMYNDIAHNTQNPTPGIIINKPNGSDVYAGVKIDYQHADVTPQNFLNVLTGKPTTTGGPTLKSGPEDYVFINFADHGGPGIIAFPNSLLHAKDLISAIEEMHSKRMYKKLVIYMEACESGSMFYRLLDKNVAVYALTASNERESSYACYFDNKRRTYLGDVFSVKWMEDTDVENINTESLEKQYTIVKRETNTSHVMQYGDLSITTDPVGQYQGNLSPSVTRTDRMKISDAVPQRNVIYEALKHQIANSKSKAEKDYRQWQLVSYIKDAQKIATAVTNILTAVTSSTTKPIELSLARLELRDHKCYRKIVDTFHERCYNLGQITEASRHLYKFVNACEKGYKAEDFVRAMKVQCTDRQSNPTSV